MITADDFGLHAAVNAAVEIAHTRGALTAASLMVGAPATAEAVAIARALPGLRVGLHIVLTEGRPVLPPETVPHLVGADGAFRKDMVALAVEIFASSAARRELAAEIRAQFAAFAATGLQLDHANAHKHFHVHPTIAAAIARAGARRSAFAPSERSTRAGGRSWRRLSRATTPWVDWTGVVVGLAGIRPFPGVRECSHPTRSSVCAGAAICRPRDWRP